MLELRFAASQIRGVVTARGEMPQMSADVPMSAQYRLLTLREI